jgi:hypothetical protein
VSLLLMLLLLLLLASDATAGEADPEDEDERLGCDVTGEPPPGSSSSSGPQYRCDRECGVARRGTVKAASISIS